MACTESETYCMFRKPSVIWIQSMILLVVLTFLSLLSPLFINFAPEIPSKFLRNLVFEIYSLRLGYFFSKSTNLKTLCQNGLKATDMESTIGHWPGWEWKVKLSWYSKLYLAFSDMRGETCNTVVYNELWWPSSEDGWVGIATMIRGHTGHESHNLYGAMGLKLKSLDSLEKYTNKFKLP